MAPRFAGLNARVKLALDEGGVAREVLPFDEEDERAAGAIRAALESAGTPIGAHDTLIAGQTRRRDPILVTANAAEFERTGGLRRQDWTRARR